LAGPLIVTAELGSDDFAWLNGLRRQHYPVDRNVVSAHLSVFRALPPSAEAEIRHLLAEIALRKAPRASIAGLMSLGGGVAFRILSDELDRLREEMSDRLHGLLSAQDVGGWIPHVTIQNKVPPREARALSESIGSRYDRRPVMVSGLGLHRYLGGPWETLRTFSFRG
jgi:2'-5' RNA ligase superfamily